MGFKADLARAQPGPGDLDEGRGDGDGRGDVDVGQLEGGEEQDHGEKVEEEIHRWLARSATRR